MKVILITLFLNYELFVCKTVHKVHKQTQGTNFHLRGQPQFKKGHKVFGIEDKVLYRRRDFPEYDVTGIFWGGQTDLERMPKPYTTSTFLPPPEREEPVLTLAPTPTEEDEEPITMPPTPEEDEEPITMPPTPEDELQSPEQIDDNTWPYLRPPGTEPTDTVYTNYPGYPYEPPPFSDSVIKDRDKDNYIKLTPQPTQSYTRPPDVIYDYTNTEPGTTNDGITNHTYYVSIPLNRNKPSEYTINPEAFPSSVPALPPDIDSMYTLKPEPNIGTRSTPTPTTSTPSTTIKPLWKVVQRNVEINLNSNVNISEKDMSNVKKWFSKVTAGTPVQKWFSSWVGLTTGPQMSTLSKSQIWLQKMKDLGIPVHRDDPVDYKLSTATRATASFTLKTDSHDILRKTPEYNPLASTTIEVATGLPGTPGNVLYENIVTFATPAPSLRQVYFKLMEDRNEGFLTIFLQEIFRITSEKDKRLVKELLMEVEPHINTWYDTDRLMWFGQPLADTIVKLSRFLSVSEIDYIRSYSSMLYHMLQTRKTAVAVDLNSIIEYADLLYTDGEGWELFDAIMEYERYPNGTRNAKQLCEFIFDCFMRPYRRLSHLERGQTLFNSINTALNNKFPSRRLNGILLRIEPQTTTNGIKSKYLQEEYKRSRRNRKRTNEKKEVADDVINHFSSRLNNKKFAKTTKKYTKEVKTPVINNYYILTATKTNNKAVRNKVNCNENKETTKNYKNLLFGNIFDDQTESILYADSRLDRNPYFNDFGDVKHDTASNKYLTSNRKAMHKNTEEESNFESEENHSKSKSKSIISTRPRRQF